MNKTELLALIESKREMKPTIFRLTHNYEEIVLAVALNQEYYYISSQFEDVKKELQEVYDVYLSDEEMFSILKKYREDVNNAFGN